MQSVAAPLSALYDGDGSRDTMILLLLLLSYKRLGGCIPTTPSSLHSNASQLAIKILL